MSERRDDRKNVWTKPCQECGSEVDIRTGVDTSVEVTVSSPSERVGMVFCDLVCARKYLTVVGE